MYALKKDKASVKPVILGCLQGSLAIRLDML